MHDHLRVPHRQAGLASISFVLLVGLVVAASSTGTMQSIRKSQEINVALNATTHAQTGLWAATEAFRRYLEAIDADTINALSGNLAITMDPAYGELAAGGISVQHMPDGSVRVSADITNRHAAARSSAAHHVVFEVGTGGGGAPASVPGFTLDFNHDFRNTGELTLLSGDAPVDINVDGDVSLGGHNLNAMTRINATGRVEVGGTAGIESIYAGDDVELYQGATVRNVETLGNFTATQGGGAENVWANGDVRISSNGWFSSVNSLKNITIAASGSAGHGDLLAGETVSIGYGPTNSARAVGNLSLSTPDRLDTAATMGDLTCGNPGWRAFSSLRANGSITDCASSSAGAPVTPGAGDTIVPMSPIVERSMMTSRIDVHPLKAEANYVVEWDGSAGRRGLVKVTVNQVEGVDDGAEFHLGDYPPVGRTPGHAGYLCTNVDSRGECQSPAQPLLPLCLAADPESTCITYSASTNTFTFSPANLAPGVMFIDGNAELQNGRSVTAVLASGAVKVGGTVRLWAPNYGSYDRVCLADVSHDPQMNAKVRGRYVDAFSVHYPGNLCDTAAGTYNAIPVGNISLAAGGSDPDTGGGSYRGGDIEVAGTTDIVGAVLAGGLLDLGGTTSIAGVISSGSPGDARSYNQTTNEVTIDLTVRSDDYDPARLPGRDVSAGTGPVGPTLASLLWVRPY